MEVWHGKYRFVKKKSNMIGVCINGSEKGFGDETSFKGGRLVTPQNGIISLLVCYHV